MKIIDLRSDTVTKPTPSMRAAMAAAEVGDDVYGEDPTVNRLEELTASQLGMEAGLFVASGTMSNLLAIMSHCERGDEYIAGDTAHCYRFEGGGAAVLGSIQPHPLPYEENGTLDLVKVAAAVKPADPHFARTRLLCLENTWSGHVLPLSYLREASRFCRDAGLALHLDGARVFNAAVALDVPVREITAPFDTVSVCLSKGLGAPVGSVLCGSAAHIGRARRWRKVLGGGMRQAGILAAAGILAIEEGPSQLAADHENARRLAASLAEIFGAPQVRWSGTNMVFLHLELSASALLQENLDKHGIRISGRDAVRLVTHRDVSREDIDRVVAVIAAFCSEQRRSPDIGAKGEGVNDRNPY